MTNPLYSVGQDVSVFIMRIMLAIPATKVTEVVKVCAGDRVTDTISGRTGTIMVDIFMYKTEHYPVPIQECFLKPINPDTEYLEDEITISNGENAQ